MSVVFHPLLKPIILAGTPYQRGKEHGKHIKNNNNNILRNLKADMCQAAARYKHEEYLKQQYSFAKKNCHMELAELKGIAEGSGVSVFHLFHLLNKSILRDWKKISHSTSDGCSAWVCKATDGNHIAVKNRDSSTPDTGRQAVFIHKGNDLENGDIICVGSLGAPGVYSSGMNAKGLVVMDTHVGTKRHDVGWVRYFLMTRILRKCSNVNQAILLIMGCAHAGGGSLILADSYGNCASVELSSDSVYFDRSQPALRTNHFISYMLSGQTLHHSGDDIDRNSYKRFDFLAKSLSTGVDGVEHAKHIMSTHRSDSTTSAPVCQHREHGEAITISTAIYVVDRKELQFSGENPCHNKWSSYAL